jgi:hypothetical protein
MSYRKKASRTRRRREDGAPSRWDQYRELLVRKRVPEKAQRWYVAHVLAFAREQPPEARVCAKVGRGGSG